MSQKVVIIGLDGATFDVLQPWIEAGELPTLKGIMRNGVSGKLRSVIPPVTTTAWSSFMTGKNPGKHGIYYFTARDKATGQEVPINATLRDGRTLWDLLSGNGKRVLVLNVPTTYPPHPVNGVMIADFLTPKGRRDFIYPRFLVDEIEDRFGPYPLYLKTPMCSANLSEANVQAFLNELHEELAYKFKVTHYLMDKYPSDFTMLHIWGTDRMQHELWNLLDPTHPKHDRGLAAKCQERILGYFKAMDTEVEDLRRRLEDETSLLIISDHGFGPIYKYIDLNVWLLKEGYLAIKRTPLAWLKHLAWRMGLTFDFVFTSFLRWALRWGWRGPDIAPADGLKWLEGEGKLPFLSLRDVDWSRTKAYCRLGMGQITINLQGRYPQGSVPPGKEYQEVRNEISRKLQELRDPETGKKIGGEIYLREDIYWGKHLDEAPDITFLPLGRNCLAGNFLGFSTNKWITDTNLFIANHRMDGILMAEGKPFSQGRWIEVAEIVDLAPTILYLMGSKIPRDMDGKVLEGMFTEDFLRHHPIEVADPPEPASKVNHEMSAEDEQEILQRLKDLGYL